MAKKFYAIKKGLVPGIYENWDDAKAQVSGFPGAEYKGFQTKEEAEAYLGGMHITTANAKPTETKRADEKAASEEKRANVMDPQELYELPYAFVDGSFNPESKVYGCGGFLFDDKNERHPIQASGSDEEMASMRNVAGEILGATLAIKKALELGLPKLTIYYDYEGIKHWAEQTWKRNKKGTMEYAEFVASVRNQIRLEFVHVKAHTGIPGNEEADQMAKEAVGIS